MKHKVNINKIPDEYKPLCKTEMTNEEIGQLGTVIMKMKVQKIKNKLGLWFKR